jgi:5S rRNA maturation endonuclease (ribonuclease M5)
LDSGNGVKLMGQYSKEYLDDIRVRVAVSKILGQTHKLEKEGREWRAVDDKSLTVNDEKKIWWDHSKNVGGDIFKWIELTQGLSFAEAVEECAKIAGVQLPGANGAARANGHAKEEKPVDLKGRKIIKTYDYTDAGGDLLYQVVRFEPKGFAQRRRPRGDYDDPADREGWIWNLHGVEHGLYRLVELCELAGPDDLIFLPEGEKDVDTLFNFGLAATTNSGGARHWRADHAETFRDRDVVVLVDHDETGRERGKTIAKTLNGIARSVRVIDIAAATWPGAPKGADVTDWLKAREGTVDELLEVVRTTPEWKAEGANDKAWPGPDMRLVNDDRPPAPRLTDAALPAGWGAWIVAEAAARALSPRLCRRRADRRCVRLDRQRAPCRPHGHLERADACVVRADRGAEQRQDPRPAADPRRQSQVGARSRTGLA